MMKMVPIGTHTVSEWVSESEWQTIQTNTNKYGQSVSLVLPKNKTNSVGCVLSGFLCCDVV